MKIVFIGTVEFSHAALEKLLSLNANIVGVVTKKQSHYVPICGGDGLAPVTSKRSKYPRPCY